MDSLCLGKYCTGEVRHMYSVMANPKINSALVESNRRGRNMF